MIPAMLVVGFVVYRQVGKKSHGTETSRAITFSGHATSPNAQSHLFTADGRHKDMCHEPVSILSSFTVTLSEWTLFAACCFMALLD